MIGMAGVRFGPPAGWTLREELIAVGTLGAGDAPWLHFIRKMTDVPFVVECEPLERPVPDTKRIEFVTEIPFHITVATGHRRRIVDIVRCHVTAIELV